MEGFLLPLGAVFVLTSVILFVLQSERQDVILERFFKRRRDSGSRTPPRSLSPEKKRSQSISTPDYSSIFPPSRRCTLVKSSLQTAPVEAAAASHLDWSKRILPMTSSYLEASDDTYTPCEFSIAEIKALGDFPDYATLSGVPLPEPYYTFDIHKALPRPYRPFRWAYHQTMCKWDSSCLEARTNCTHSAHEDGAGLVAGARKHIRGPHEAALTTVTGARRCGTSISLRL